MIAMIQEPDWNDRERDVEWEQGAMERFNHRSRADFPVRSYGAQTRAKMRSRATPAAKRKARSFHGANYRGSHRHWALTT
jgi:hypothetical protein